MRQDCWPLAIILVRPQCIFGGMTRGAFGQILAKGGGDKGVFIDCQAAERLRHLKRAGDAHGATMARFIAGDVISEEGDRAGIQRWTVPVSRLKTVVLPAPLGPMIPQSRFPVQA